MLDSIDNFWMQEALNLAAFAASKAEVPVGAVLVLNGKKIGQGYNQPIMTHDPCAHAEIVALRQGGAHIKNYRLLDTTLYVSLEPCVMCAGAMVHARIKRLVFGAFDLKTGAAGSVVNIFQGLQVNHSVQVQGGVLELQSSKLLKEFFQARRL